MTWSGYQQFRYWQKFTIWSIILIDGFAFLKSIHNCASDDINATVFSGYSTMEGWNPKINIQRNFVPLDSLSLSDLVDEDSVKSRVCHLEKM